MREGRQWTDDEVVAHLTDGRPLSSYMFIGDCLYSWLRLVQPDGIVWMTGLLLIEDDSLAKAAPGAMRRAGVQQFLSHEEAQEYARTQLGSVVGKPKFVKREAF